MTVKLPTLMTLLVAGLSVAACSSERPDTPGFDIARSLIKPKVEGTVSDPQQIASAASASLEAISGPLALATFEKTSNSVVLREIETNGPYRTWANVGSSERRSISTRNGILTSTRGLNNDLMSSDVSQTLALLSSRSSGTATRVQRYLDGENQITAITATCTISRGKDARVQVGEIDRMAAEMTERCTSDIQDFTNIYRVDSSGRVLQSVQWFNEFYGVTVIQQLR